MISLSCFAYMKGLHRVVESAINCDSGNFHSVLLGKVFSLRSCFIIIAHFFATKKFCVCEV